MALTLTIAGAAQSILDDGAFQLSQTANGRATFACSILSKTGTYRPALDATVVLTEDATVIFGGLLDRPTEHHQDDTVSDDSIVTTISAGDYLAYADRRYVNETLAAGTLKSMLTTLVANYLTGYGVTLDAGQVNGPTLTALTYEYKLLTEVLNELAVLTAEAGEPFVWRISATKVLRMYQPSTTAAPFNITQTPRTPEVIGDVEVEISRDDYANRIILRVPAKSEANHVETFTADGIASSFALDYTLTGMRYVVNNDGVDELLTFQGIGFDLAVQWLYYESDNTIRRMTSGVADPPANGNVITITFDGTSPAIGVIAEDAGEIASVGIWEEVVTVDTVPSDTTAQALADAYLAKRLNTIQTVRYRTYASGLAVGQSQTITIPRRNLSGTAVITEIVTRNVGPLLERRVTAVIDSAQTNLERGWRDVYKLWAKQGGAGGNAVSVGEGAPAVTGPAPPDRAVQFNNHGSFGGDESFLFDPDTDTATLGDDHEVVALFQTSCGDDGDPADHWAIVAANITVDSPGQDSTYGIGSTTAPYSDPWLVAAVDPDPGDRVRFKWSQWIPPGTMPFTGFATYVVAGVYWANGAAYAFSNRQLSINTTDDGKFLFKRGSFSGTTIAGPTTNPVWVENTWNEVEVEVVIHNTLGTITLWKAGVEVLSATGLDTQALGSALIDGVEIIPQGVAGSDALIDNVEINISRRNLLTGSEHYVDGDDNLLAGIGNTIRGYNSQAHGTEMTVEADRSIAFGLDGSPHTLTDDGTFAIYGILKVVGAISLGTGTGFVRALAGVYSAAKLVRVVGAVIGSGSAVITTGPGGAVTIPVTGTITKVRLLSSDASVTSGSIVIDVWKDTYANYPPTVADTITASAKPTITTATKSEDSTLTGWTTAVTAGDVLRFNVDSVTSLKRVTVELTIEE